MSYNPMNVGQGGAAHMASIFGTERDRVNCPFYFKIGACRHGLRCSRVHARPSSSPTLLFPNMYQSNSSTTWEDFLEDVWEEMERFGVVDEVKVCENVADHLVGNVYVKFEEERDAEMAHKDMQGRFYNGRPLTCEFSPVSDFSEATCRQHDEASCKRGGYCNFMHLKPVPPLLMARLYAKKKRMIEDRMDARRLRDEEGRGRERRRRSRSRSRERETSEERRARIAEWSRERRQQREVQDGEEETPACPPVIQPDEEN